MKQTLDTLRVVVGPLVQKKHARRIEEWQRTASPGEVEAAEAMAAHFDSEEDSEEDVR
jgi:hypothetical protein